MAALDTPARYQKAFLLAEFDAFSSDQVAIQNEDNIMRTLDFSGESVIVTGAGNGIGKARALLVGSLVASVVVNDIDATSAQATAEEIRACGGVATECVADVTDPQRVIGCPLNR